MIYGKLEFTGTHWRFVKSDPEVRQRLRRLFINARGQGENIDIPHTVNNCEDVEWIIDRYEHEADDGIIDMLRKIASSARETRELARLTMLNASYTPQPAELVIPLRDYQRQGVDLARLQKGLLLADVVGLGKTATAIGLMVLEECRPALVVCPTHLQFQWREEIALFAPSLRTHIIAQTKPYKLPDHDVTIITYAKLAGWIDETRWKTIVYDECHELRRQDSQKTKTAHYFAKKAEYRLGLSGTPIYNYPLEIWTIMQALRPDDLGTCREFCNEWEIHEKGMSDPEALGTYLRQRYFMLRRERKDVKRELPAVQTVVNMMAYDPKVMKRLEKEALTLAKNVLQGKFTERGKAARQLDIKLRQATGIAKAPAVAEFVSQIAKGGEKVLLGGWHREVYNVWCAIFRKNGVRFVMYTGEENTKEKDAAVKRFVSGGVDVFIISLRSGAGINGLQNVCSTAVSGELDWTPKVHEQFVGRIARDGQGRPVSHFYCLMNNGSDPVIASVLGLKEAQSNAVVDPGKDVSELFTTSADSDEGRGRKLAEMWIAHHGNMTADVEIEATP